MDIEPLEPDTSIENPKRPRFFVVLASIAAALGVALLFFFSVALAESDPSVSVQNTETSGEGFSSGTVVVPDPDEESFSGSYVRQQFDKMSDAVERVFEDSFILDIFTYYNATNDIFDKYNVKETPCCIQNGGPLLRKTSDGYTLQASCAGFPQCETQCSEESKGSPEISSYLIKVFDYSNEYSNTWEISGRVP